jgi:DnaJ-class molecular chaperone
LNGKDYYDILGVQKSATEDEIKKAYRKKSLKVHPDKNKCPEAQDAFKRLSQAYMCLSDENKRKSYDMFGNEEDFLRSQQSQGHNPFQNFDPHDLFR